MNGSMHPSEVLHYPYHQQVKEHKQEPKTLNIVLPKINIYENLRPTGKISLSSWFLHCPHGFICVFGGFGPVVLHHQV